MGHLYYSELDNGPAAQNLNTKEFENLLQGQYWSSTEWSPGHEGAWEFDFAYGVQGPALKIFDRFAMAVHDGDISSVPIPGAIWLFGTSVFGLAGIRRKMKSC